MANNTPGFYTQYLRASKELIRPLARMLQQEQSLSYKLSFLTVLIGICDINGTSSDAEHLSAMLKKMGMKATKLDQQLDKLKKKRLIVPKSGHSSPNFEVNELIQSFVRTGSPFYLVQFDEFKERPPLALLADHIFHVNYELDNWFNQPRSFRTTTRELIQSIRLTPIFKHFYDGLQEVNSTYSIELAGIACMACAQYEMNRSALPLKRWLPILAESLSQQRALLNALNEFVRSDEQWSAEFTSTGDLESLKPSAKGVKEWDLDQNLVPFQLHRSDDQFTTLAPDETPEHHLVFEDHLQQELNLIAHALEGNNFETRRAAHGTKKIGLKLQFVGPPGTGKTATAQHWARTTGRHLIVVDLAGLRSKWVGESEQKTRQLFSKLAATRKQLDREPIVLLDEADGFFHRRHPDGSDHPVEANLIAILLQEIEKFDGILLATTNYASRMDEAFKRRFLDFHHFPALDATKRAQVIRLNFPELTLDEALLIAEIHPASPADIERAANRNRMIYGYDLAQLSAGERVRLVREWIRSSARSLLQIDQDATGSAHIGFSLKH